VIGRGDQEIQQQIVRIDRIDSARVDGPSSVRLIASIEECLESVDALLISDYENGVISSEILERALPRARQRDLVIAVDSHGDLFRFKGVTVATPNQPEAEATLGRAITTREQLEEAGEELRAGMDAHGVLITRGSQGMALFERDRPPFHLAPTNLREVFDPTGAGDTACAVFTLALLAGSDMAGAAILSNLAAGEVVKRLGAATLSAEDLEEVMRRAEP
jgi:rfaE bifunctional protein kinase chain/domain